MKFILNFFIKDYKFKSDVELFRVKSFVITIFSALLLLFAFMIRTALLGCCTALYTQYLYLVAGIASLFLIKKGKIILIGNFLSILIVLTEIFALFSNMSNAKPFNFFVDEFYVFIVFIFFSTMFAERYVLLINTFLILFSSIFAYYFYLDSFLPSILPELNFGIGIYVIAVLAVFLFNYLYSRTIIRAIKEISEKINVSEQKNKELINKQYQLKKNQVELKKAKEKAEENNKLKSIFLSNVSHEIRTPMNSILGFTQVLKETKLSEKQFEYISVIENSGKHLLKGTSKNSFLSRNKI